MVQLMQVRNCVGNQLVVLIDVGNQLVVLIDVGNQLVVLIDTICAQ